MDDYIYDTIADIDYRRDYYDSRNFQKYKAERQYRKQFCQKRSRIFQGNDGFFMKERRIFIFPDDSKE